MVQSSLVGVFFFIGLAAGLILSFIVTNSSSVYNTSIEHLFYRAENKSVLLNRPPLSHEELNRIPSPKYGVKFDDKHAHRDDDTVALELFLKVRVLCWVMTSPENLESKARHVRQTWGKRCNKLLFVSDKEDKDFPTISINIAHGRQHLTGKTMAAFDYIYKNHLDDADWFIKTDDDTYVIVENLRYMLKDRDKNDPVYFGHAFKVIVKQGYASGGGGYVASREALRRFGQRKASDCAKDFGAEDVEFGHCMEKLKVRLGDSRDALGRTRFHCFNPETHLQGGYPDWYLQYDKYGAKKGLATMSDYPVTFHYVTVQQMYDLEYYVYHMRPYGIVSGAQNLNSPPVTTTTRPTTNRPKS